MELLERVLCLLSSVVRTYCPPTGGGFNSISVPYCSEWGVSRDRERERESLSTFYKGVSAFRNATVIVLGQTTYGATTNIKRVKVNFRLRDAE